MQGQASMSTPTFTREDLAAKQERITKQRLEEPSQAPTTSAPRTLGNLQEHCRSPNQPLQIDHLNPRATLVI
jgi:hypothetical protein